MSKKHIVTAVAAFVVSLFCLVSSASVEAGSYTDFSTKNSIPYETDLSGHTVGNVAGFLSDLLPNGSVNTVINGNNSQSPVHCDSSTYCGARSLGKAVAPINAWGTCAWVDNTSSQAVFVPFRTQNEWFSFLDAANKQKIPGVTVTNCSLPYTQTGGAQTVIATPPYAKCESTATATPIAYGRNNGASTWVSSNPHPTFSCHKDDASYATTSVESFLQWTSGNGNSWSQNFLYGPDLTLTVVEAGKPANKGAVIDIYDGSSVVLSWTTDGAYGQTWTCEASGAWSGSKKWTGDSEQITPHNSGAYKLACKDNRGLTSTTSVTVNVNKPNQTAIICGADAGQVLTSAPTQLCAPGDIPSAVTYTGSGWGWTCSPPAGGCKCETRYCSATKKIAPPPPINGQCGNDNGTTTSGAPSNLCATGTPSTVTGNGPWSWMCTGSNGGTNVNCGCNPPPVVVNGQCGAENGATTSSAPTTDLCAKGTASAVTGTGPWAWTCAGANGGTKAYCAANPPPQKVCGVCGSANGTVTSIIPTTGLCSSGTATAIAGTGPWTWSCTGANGGDNAYCSASPPPPPPPVNGDCGAANGTVTSTKPTTGLCSSGIASAVSGTGPWAWSCAGVNGGTSASCAATPPAPPPPTNGQCGPENGATTTATPTTGLCSSGTASVVAGTGPWTWNCTGSNGGTNACCSANPPVPVNGQCGPENGATITDTPTTGLCTTGTASAVSGTGPWGWTCSGMNGGTTANCGATPPTPICGVCGPENGMTVSSAPTTGLCSSGTASAVSGNGPWAWTCVGSYGGTTASCSATPPAPPINGQCGASNGTTVNSVPTTGLCAAGSASTVGGTGPWSWTCSGSNGGSSVSCGANPPPPPSGDSGTGGDGGDGGGDGGGGDGGGGD